MSDHSWRDGIVVGDGLKRLREPAGWLVLGALVVSLLMSLINLAVSSSVSQLGSFSSAAHLYGRSLMSAFSIIVLALLVGSCVLWQRTRNARMLALLSAIVVSAGVVLMFLFVLLGLAAPGDGLGKVTGFFADIASLVIPALAGLALWRLYQGQPAPVAQPELMQPDQSGYGHPGDGARQDLARQQGYGQQPSWQPDQAVGASWNTAGAAASGASATDWGHPGEQGGWNIAPPQPPASQPSPASEPATSQPADQGHWRPADPPQPRTHDQVPESDGSED